MSDFTPWNGGEMPVPPLSHVEVQFRDSSLNSYNIFYSQAFDWSHDGSAFDIVAYKVADEQPLFKVWNGGVNPVGDAIVEYILRDSMDEVNCTRANNLDWEHVEDDPDYDIILYRIID